MAEHYLETGSIGWRHEGWKDSYYPDDLPEDWQLEFYSHLFRIIALPCSDWLNASAEDVEQWREDASDEFAFFLLLDRADRIEEQIEKLTHLGILFSDSLLGIVVMQDQINLSDSVLNELSERFRVIIDSEKILPDNNRVSVCWRPDRETTQASVAILTSEQSEKPRQMREYIESFLQQASEQRELYLLFAGEPPGIKAMQDAQVIGQMLTDV